METNSAQQPPSPVIDGPYGVVLDVFEGPLDLLLFLIRKNEVDIYDIPIAVITNEYLGFLGQVHLLELESACDFILMAATLMKIKSQLLLPREFTGEEEGDDADPRAELVRRLLEYQQFKEIADWLGDQGLDQRDAFRNRPSSERDEEGAVLSPVSLFDLLKAFKHVVDHVPREIVHRVVEDQISVEECVEAVLAELDRRSRLRFFDLVAGKSKHALVVTFVGVLELLKSQRIRVQQAQPFDEIWIERSRGDGAPALDAGAAPDAGGKPKADISQESQDPARGPDEPQFADQGTEFSREGTEQQ